MKQLLLLFALLFTVLLLPCQAQDDWVSLNGPASSEVLIIAPTVFGSWFALLPHDNILNRHYQIIASWDDRQSWTGVRTVSADIQPMLQTDHHGNKYLLYEGNFERSTDEGITWTKSDTLGVVSRLSEGLDYRLILSTSDGIYISTNTGDSWTHIATPVRFKAATSGKNGYIYALGGTRVYRSTDIGTTWSSVHFGQFGFEDNAYIRCDSRNNIFVKSYSALYRSTDDGTTWDAVSTPLKDVSHVQVAGSGLIFIASKYDQIAVSSDLGNSWRIIQIHSPKGNAIHSLSMDMHENLILATQFGGFRYDPVAMTSERIFSTAGNFARTERLGTLAGGLLPLAADGIPYLYNTASDEWRAVPEIVLIADSVRGAAGNADGIMFSGTRELAASTNAGQTWRLYTIDTSFRYLKPPLCSPSGKIYLPIWKDEQSRFQFEGIYLTTDNGSQWNKLSCNIKTPDYLYVDAHDAFYILDGFLLWKTTDAGATFDVFQLPDTPSLFRITRDGEWFAVYNDSLYASSDLGTTWRNTDYLEAQTISFIVKNGTGNTYIGRSTGHIWRSQSDTAPWKLHITGLPLVELLDIVYESDNYMYAGTRNGLYRSTKSFSPTVLPDIQELSFALDQSYPNPIAAGERAALTYTLPQAADISIKVCSILGVEVYSAALGRQNEGTHSYSLPTRGLKPGVYRYVLTTSTARQSRTMIVR